MDKSATFVIAFDFNRTEGHPSDIYKKADDVLEALGFKKVVTRGNEQISLPDTTFFGSCIQSYVNPVGVEGLHKHIRDKFKDNALPLKRLFVARVDHADFYISDK